jgi:hypothetical protein
MMIEKEQTINFEKAKKIKSFDFKTFLQKKKRKKKKPQLKINIFFT